MKRKIFLVLLLALSIGFFYRDYKKTTGSNMVIGQKVDSLNQVYVYYNGSIGNVVKRNTKDGYNLGLEFQCVEFVKRYYYEFYNHKMPDSYGHAVSFFDKKVKDGQVNKQRNLLQFTNPSKRKPQVGDLIVLKGTIFNRYGHVAIISNVLDNQIEIIQQNPGPSGASRVQYELMQTEQQQWKINQSRILGWLRMI